MNRPKRIYLFTCCISLAALVVAVLALASLGVLPTLTEIRLGKLGIGMTEEEAEAILGKPKTVIANEDILFWHYDTWRRHDEPYVVFDKNRLVMAFGKED